MTCSVYFDRHAVAVPFTLFNDGSLAAQAISPAAALTGSPPAVVVVVGEALVVVGEALVVVGDALVVDDVVVVVVVVGEALVVDDVVVVPDRTSCGGVVVSRLVMFRAAVAPVVST